ncbi:MULTISPECIES: TadE/TadG family type IV pilus assembly protein [Pseudomonas]|jgi:Flp pilus assembly protein TadG|uniref:TadE/TadG family type IV pilus assembly protein n=1 Tax=Pseudomonas TaxID=286 RepID=UPI0003724B28|nr:MULTISPECIES: TadE/TadG family type IV pilus assembly protein [Pseudomonas]MBD9606263.1 pilus assembly protein [Pseudomonas sp. PDM08]MBD9617288.1 pilus assembly protein [Pseudomonas sp. PDM07]MDR7109369.1 Flp pilus assembly protein TadG [Pseudomonas frederiksbergensis]PZW53969.1 Flp pilus assembly protein TadG [Pseudomonas sp. URMO17WK12:I6]
MGLHSFKRPQAQQGVALVEFTLVLPLLLLLLLSLGEFGRMLYQYNVLLQASRDADRFVASQAWDSTLGAIALSNTLLTQTKNVAVYGVPSATGSAVVSGLTTANVAVAAVGTDHVRVTITYSFCPVIGSGNCVGTFPGLIGGQFALAIPLVATTVMRVL